MDYPEGIDVSGHQKAVDWPAVKAAGISFAIIKATQGDGFISEYYESQVAGARAQGLIVGHYHFFSYKYGTPAQQAEHYLLTIGAVGMGAGDLPPIVDLESPTDAKEPDVKVAPARFIREYHEYIDRVEQRTGKKVIIYTYPDWWRNRLGNPADFSTWSESATPNPLWLAVYTPSTTPPPTSKIPGGWRQCLFHQYTATGRVPGVGAGIRNVDRNRFVGTIDELRVLAGLAVDGGLPCRFYPETGQYLCHGFRDYYDAHGGLAAFGYPITDERQETVGDWTGVVQWFERARFEWHLDAQGGHVELGRVGAELLALRGPG